MTTKKLQIAGMHCTSCAMDIDFDLEDLDGVIEANTKYANSQTSVAFDENKITIEEIIAQINKLGYNANILN